MDLFKLYILYIYLSYDIDIIVIVIVIEINRIRDLLLFTQIEMETKKI